MARPSRSGTAGAARAASPWTWPDAGSGRRRCACDDGRRCYRYNDGDDGRDGGDRGGRDGDGDRDRRGACGHRL